MAFTVRAAEHLSCTETVFPRMRDRGSLLLRQAAPLSVFGCPGVAALISPRARAFPPRCRTAGPCAFLSEGRSGRSLRNAPRGRDLRRRINRGPHGSEEPQSAAGAAFRTDRTLCPACTKNRTLRKRTLEWRRMNGGLHGAEVLRICDLQVAVSQTAAAS